MNRRVVAGVGMALLILGADQLSKWWVLHGLDLPDRGSIALLPMLNFTMVWNHGVTFGLLTSHNPAGPYILGAIAVGVVIGLGLWLKRATTLLTAVPIGAIAGGAIGNVIDRFHHGAVVDFIHVHAFGYSWYVFNVADAAIVCGVTALMVEGLVQKKPRPQSPAMDQVQGSDTRRLL